MFFNERFFNLRYRLTLETSASVNYSLNYNNIVSTRTPTNKQTKNMSHLASACLYWVKIIVWPYIIACVRTFEDIRIHSMPTFYFGTYPYSVCVYMNLLTLLSFVDVFMIKLTSHISRLVLFALHIVHLCPVGLTYTRFLRTILAFFSIFSTFNYPLPSSH